MTEVVDFIETVLNSLDFTITINSFLAVGANTTLYTCTTYHARAKSVITIDGDDYIVDSFVNNTSITIVGLPANPTSGTLATPNYFHGTASATNSELNKIEDINLKMPCLYCYEIIIETFDDTPDAIIDREAVIRLYYLDSANFGDWSTLNHYNYVIHGMRNFQEHFFENLKTNSKVGVLGSHQVVNHVKFGVFEDNKGYTKKIFDEPTSGVELTMSLPLLKGFCTPGDACVY